MDPENLASRLRPPHVGHRLAVGAIGLDGADWVSLEHHHLQQIVESLRTSHDFVVVDLDKKFDDHTLDVIGLADVLRS